MPKLSPLTAMERHVSNLFMEVAEAIKRATPRRDVLLALDAGDFTGAVQAIRWEAGEAMLRRRLPTILRTALEQSAHLASDQVQRRFVRTKASAAQAYFDVYDDKVVAWARQHAAELIKEFGESSMRAIRRLVVANVSGEITRKQLVDLIIDSGIGLTERAVGTLEKYRLGLQETTTLTDAQIEYRVRRMAQRLLRQRAQTIARTEVARARTFGKLSAWEQAAEDGFFDSDEAMKVWRAHPEACDECAELDGEEVGLDESFSNGEDGPPDHPNCKCDVELAEPA